MTSVESHPQYPQIIKWIADGQDAGKIAQNLHPPLHRTTIWRFIRNKVHPAMQGPASVVSDLAAKGLLRQDVRPEQALEAVRAATATALHADPLLSRIAQHRATVDGKIADTDAKGAAALISADLRGLELEAKLTGRLEQSGPQVNMLIVCQAGESTPEPADDCATIDITPGR